MYGWNIMEGSKASDSIHKQIKWNPNLSFASSYLVLEYKVNILAI